MAFKPAPKKPEAPAAPKGELVKANPAQVATALPDFLAGTAGIGNENVTSQDISLPRLHVLQALSPELDKASAKYIQGAEVGDVVNTLTSEIVCKSDSSFRVLDVLFQKVYGVFRDRKFGGGFRGQHELEVDAKRQVAADPEGDKLEIVETAIHVCLLLNDDNQPVGEVGIFFTKSGLKCSRNLNGLLKAIPAARFASIVEFSVQRESNEKGVWYGLRPRTAGFVQDKATFERAMSFFKSMKDAKVSVANTEDTTATPGDEEEF